MYLKMLTKIALGLTHKMQAKIKPVKAVQTKELAQVAPLKSILPSQSSMKNLKLLNMLS